MIGRRHAERPLTCRDHMSVHAILRCAKCAAIFWGSQDALKKIEQKGAPA